MVQESDPSNGKSSGNSPRSNTIPSDPTDLYDSQLRLLLALIGEESWGQLAMRTGIECPSNENQFLHLFVEVDREAILRHELKFDMELLQKLELMAPASYLKEFETNPELRTFPVIVELTAKGVLRTSEKGR